MPDFNSFDYTKIEGVPEVALRVRLLGKRIEETTPVQKPDVLEIGLGAGDVTLMLTERAGSVTCLDRDAEICNTVARRLGDKAAQVRFLEIAVEDMTADAGRFHFILLQNMLEHLEDPVGVLSLLTPCLAEGGRFLVNVPLAGSLHRLLAVEMGLVSAPDRLAGSDTAYGHYRVYMPDLLKKHMNEAGLRILYEQPHYIKPFPTDRMKDLPAGIHEALMRMGSTLPELASYLYIEAAP